MSLLYIIKIFAYLIVTRLFKKKICLSEGFPGGLVVRTLPAMWEMQEMWVSSRDQEDTLEEEMATHSSILAWRIPWTEESGGLHSIGSQRVGHD